MQALDGLSQLRKALARSLDEQKPLPRGFDFSLPAINGVYNAGKYVDAGGQPPFDYPARDAPSFGHTGTRYQHNEFVGHFSILIAAKQLAKKVG